MNKKILSSFSVVGVSIWEVAPKLNKHISKSKLVVANVIRSILVSFWAGLNNIEFRR